MLRAGLCSETESNDDSFEQNVLSVPRETIISVHHDKRRWYCHRAVINSHTGRNEMQPF